VSPPKEAREQAPRHVIFGCPACGAKVRIGLPLKAGTFRCGTCKQELTGEANASSPIVVVITAKILVPVDAMATLLEELRPAFELLCIEPTRDLAEIKRAWREQLVQYHPDRVAGLGRDLRIVAEERTKALNAAYEILEEALNHSSR
jgi:DnaJ-domain-containing protein 1